MRLHPSFVPSVMPDETPTSYCSRVGGTIGRNARELARDIGTTFQGIVDGDATSLAVLTDTCGLDPRTFACTALTLTGERSYELAGQEFLRIYLNRARMYVCLACIRQYGAYGQARWHLEAYRVCLEHRCMLVPICDGKDAHSTHDFAFHAHNARDLIERAEITPMPPGTDRLAAYLARRLQGTEPDGWLTDLPAYAAARSCEFVGLAISKGVHALWHKASDLDRHVAGSLGYSVLSGGADAFLEYLRDLRRAAPAEGFGLLKVYGRLFSFLSHDNLSEGYEAVRAVMRQHLLETVAFAGGDIVLGQKMEVRRLHSIRSLGVETGLDVRLVRRRLDALGVIGEEDAMLPNDRVLVDVRKHGAELAMLPNLILRPDAERYLGLSQYQRYALDASLVTPYGSEKLKPVDHLFLRSDLDEYLQRLIGGASPLTALDNGFYRIGKAAQRCKCQPLVVVQLLAQGRLGNVRLDPERSGIAAIMVSVTELKEALVPDRDLMSTRVVRIELRCSQDVARGLVESRILPSELTRHPVSATRCRMVKRSDFEAFVSRYISVNGLALETGRHHRNVLRLVTEMKVEPALDPAVTRTLFFERSRMAPIMERLRA